MRLDHLLSTEFSGRRSGVRRVAHASGMVPGFRVGVLVWKRSLASRVPFGGPGSGMGMLLGSRTATRDLVACGFPGVPGGMASACGPLVVSVRVRGGLRTG